MKICYLYNPNGKRDSDDTEGHVARALSRLGHHVIMVPERRTEAIPATADMLLFHKGGPKIHEVLKTFRGRKVCWYFDKVWGDRVEWMDRTLELADFVFLSDGDEFIRRQSPKMRLLRQGIDEDMARLKPRDRKPIDVAFFGSVYGDRAPWAKALFDRYGTRFQTFTNLHGQDLVDAIHASKVVVAPMYPSTDHYWSNRIYLTLGCGGLLVHPVLKDLTDYEPGVHFLGYRTDEEMFRQIDDVLAGNYREDMRSLAHSWTRLFHTIRHRLERMFKELYASQTD